MAKVKKIIGGLFFCGMASASFAEWSGPYEIDSVSADTDKSISVEIMSPSSVEGCPNSSSIKKFTWLPGGLDPDNDKIVGDMMISLIILAQSQGHEISFDVLDGCSSAGRFMFQGVHLKY